MAWPPRRSRGRRSRREQNLVLLGQAATGVALVAAVVLLVLSRISPDRFDAVRSAAADVVAPFWEAVLVPVAEMQAAAGSVADYLNAVEKVRRLEGRERIYKRDRERYEQARRENAELKALLGVVEPSRKRVGVFAIAGSTTGSVTHTALISGGAKDGVRPGQPVRAVRGLIGRTVDVGTRASRVMLLTDVNSRVPVRVVRTGLPALVMGKNLPLLDVDLSGPSDSKVVIGDRLVTSGDGGLFPPGLPVATIVSVSGDLPQARAAAPPDGLDYVIVEEPYFPSPLPAPTIPVKPPAPEDTAQEGTRP